MLNIIFCALDEEHSIKHFVDKILSQMQEINQPFRIIACLDGSTDKSYQIMQDLAKSKPIILLPIIEQKGLGKAFKRIFDYLTSEEQNNQSLKNDEDVIISMDADLTHQTEKIGELLNYFKNHNLDLLVGSRFVNNSQVKNFPLYRVAISRITAFILKILFPIIKINGEKLQDYTSGYRLYKLSIIKKLKNKFMDNFIREPEFTYTCEILIKLSQLKIKIDEAPIYYDYQQKINNSKLNILKNFKRLIILIFRLCR